MGREAARYTVGDYWLAKRRDGKSADIWQIAAYSAKSRSVVYRSTKRKALDEAKAVIHAYVDQQLAEAPQEVADAKILPQLMLYWDEHGQHAINSGQLAHSVRVWMAFFMQDTTTASVTIGQLNKAVFERFRKWRMAPHSYSVRWQGEQYAHTSKGITGESVQRNLDDFRAAINHAVSNNRIPYAPKVPSILTTLRSPARDVRLTIDQLGAVLGFVWSDRPTRRWIQMMIATAARPDASLAFDPHLQDKGDLLDMQHPDKPRTKKRNPTVPTIAPLRPMLDAWKRDTTHRAAKSRKRAWNTMRRALGLDADIIPKVIRHTIATELRRRGVPSEEISGLLGHVGINRTTAVYAKYDPTYLGKARDVLTTIYQESFRAAAKWRADHLRTKVGNGPTIVIDKIAEKPHKD